MLLAYIYKIGGRVGKASVTMTRLVDTTTTTWQIALDGVSRKGKCVGLAEPVTEEKLNPQNADNYLNQS